MKAVRLSAVRTGRLYPPGNIPGSVDLKTIVQSEGSWIKNSNEVIGNQTRDFPACSEVPVPTAQPRAPLL